MKKILALFAVLLLATACNKKFEQAMKSAEKDIILSTANDYFSQKKWDKAIKLYERLPNLVAGTDDARTVVYNSAFAYYYNKEYRVAAHHFKNFSVQFYDDSRAEEAAYMAALCYYEGSQDYNLDQRNTESAIDELQNFLNKYPNSERGKNINMLIEELSYKLEFKAYENARQYYKMSEYKAANVAFENVLEDFPSTQLRPKIYDFILKSRYELAVNSVFSLKEDRLNDAIAYTRFVEKELPGTNYAKTAQDLRQKLMAESERFQKQKVSVEAEQQKFIEKQKKLQEENQLREAKKSKGKKAVAQYSLAVPAKAE